MDEELTMAQAAARFGVPKPTLNYAARQGTLKARKLGSQWVTTGADVGRWMASSAHVPTRAPKHPRQRQAAPAGE
jgi:excisionase family DNA binding protein